MARISVKVNGTQHSHEVEPRQLLVHDLRDVLGLTGTHVGCDTGQCGSCTVMLDGHNVKSCPLFTVQGDGSEVVTIEGLASGGKLHPVQESFWEEHGLKCGFCTPGVILSAVLRENPDPEERAIRVPVPAAGRGGADAKFPHPASRDAVVGVAALVTVSARKISAARVAITGVGARAGRATATEAALVGNAPDASVVASAAEQAVDGLTVRSDPRMDPGSWRALAVTFTRRAVATALERAG